MKKILKHLLMFCFCTIMPVLLIFLVGCMKEPEINKNFGPPVSWDDVNKALSDADRESTSASIHNIKLGEFAYNEESSQIENMSAVVFKQKADTVIKKEDFTNKILYTIQKKITELQSNGEMKPSESQSKVCLELQPDGCKQADISGNPDPSYGAHSGTFGGLSWRSLMLRNEEPNKNISYHNLRIIRGKMNLPPLVLLRSDWGGLKPKAELQTIEVLFDEVDWVDPEAPVKSSFRLVFSPDVPFFASQLVSCGSTTIPFEKTRIAIMQCDTVRDFTKGHD